MTTFRLEKLKLKDDCYSRVQENYCETGKLSMFWPNSDNPKAIELGSVKDVKEGTQLLVFNNTNYLRTSKIEKIIAMTDHQAQIETTTSIYLLEEVSQDG